MVLRRHRSSNALSRVFGRLHADDHTLLEQGIGVFDALARSFESDDEADRSPRPGRRAGRRRRT